jgi:uncharacterized cupin superfamily protein
VPVADRPSNIVGEGDLGWSEQRHGQRFGHRRRHLAAAAGGQKVGCSLYEVEPGRAAFPRHYHLANEEAIYILDGSGTLRLGEGGEEFALSKGDYVALPVGADGAHQLVNTSDVVLRYLCLSTVVEPEVLLYPDSGKVGIYVGERGGVQKEAGIFAEFLREDGPGVAYYYLDGAEVDYHDGEEDQVPRFLPPG